MTQSPHNDEITWIILKPQVDNNKDKRFLLKPVSRILHM